MKSSYPQASNLNAGDCDYLSIDYMDMTRLQGFIKYFQKAENNLATGSIQTPRL